MFNTIKTIYADAISNAHDFGKPVSVLPNTTINEYLQMDDVDVQGDHITGFYMLGLSYDEYIPDGLTTEDVAHKKTDAVVFKPIPFVIKEPGADLSAMEAKQYRLRTTITIDGKQYIAYYAKKIDDIDDRNKFLKVEVNGDVNKLDTTTLTEFKPLDPKVDRTVDIFSDTVTYVSNSRIVTISLSQGEIDEVNKAINLVYPGEDHIISEIALIAGIDYNGELYKAQTTFFSNTSITVFPFDVSNSLVKQIEIGTINASIVKN